MESGLELFFKHGPAKWNVETNYTFIDLDCIRAEFPGEYSNLIATNYAIHEHQHRHYGYSNYIFQIGRINHMVNDIVFNNRQNKTLKEQMELIFSGKITNFGIYSDVEILMESSAAFTIDRESVQFAKSSDNVKDRFLSDYLKITNKYDPDFKTISKNKIEKIAELLAKSREGFKMDILSQDDVKTLYNRLSNLRKITNSVGIPHYVIHYALNLPSDFNEEFVTPNREPQNVVLERLYTIIDAFEAYHEQKPFNSLEWLQKIKKTLDYEAGYSFVFSKATAELYEFIKKISGLDTVVFNISKFQTLSEIEAIDAIENCQDLNMFNLMQIFHDPSLDAFRGEHNRLRIMNLDLATMIKSNNQTQLIFFPKINENVIKTWLINWFQSTAINLLLNGKTNLSGVKRLEYLDDNGTNHSITNLIPGEELKKVEEKISELETIQVDDYFTWKFNDAKKKITP